jgi:hypothetical protein
MRASRLAGADQSELGVGAWIVLVVVIAGMVTLFVVIAIAVSTPGRPHR